MFTLERIRPVANSISDGTPMPTARTAPDDVVRTFAAGADDYVAKPFHMEEELARLRALVRRAAGHASA